MVEISDKEYKKLQAHLKELEKSDEKYRLISENTSDGISITTFDPNPKYTYVSPSTKRLLGYEPKELIGKSGLDYIHPDDKNKILPLLKRYLSLKIKNLLGKTAAETVEYRFKHKSGEWRYLQSRVNVIGKDALLYLTRDITERKQTEEALVASEEKFRLLIENAPIGIYYNDMKGIFLYGNKQAEEIIGYKKEELIGQNFLKLKLLGPMDIARAAKLLATNNLGKASGPDEFTLFRKNGSQIIVEINTEVIKIQNKRVVLGMVEDVTERKHAAKELKVSEDKFKMLFDHAADAVIRLSSKGIVLDANPRTGEMAGKGVENFIGKNFSTFKDIFPLSSIAVMVKNFGLRMLGKEIKPYEVKMRRPDGSLLDVEINAKVIKQEGKVTGEIVVIRDVSVRKQAEKKYREQNEILNAINKLFEITMRCEGEAEVAFACLSMAEELTKSSFGYIGEINQKGLFDTLAISNPGWKACEMSQAEARQKIVNMPLRGIDRSAMKEGKSRIVNDMNNHPDRVGTPKGHPKMTCFLGIPLKLEGKVIGMIGLGNKEGGYTNADQEAIESLAVAFVEDLYRKRAEDKFKRNVAEMEKLNKFLVGRELRIVELKDEINKLLAELGRSAKYKE